MPRPNMQMVRIKLKIIFAVCRNTRWNSELDIFVWNVFLLVVHSGFAVSPSIYPSTGARVPHHPHKLSTNCGVTSICTYTQVVFNFQGFRSSDVLKSQSLPVEVCRYKLVREFEGY
jgi:hypothetical protein